jgi:hypothetical protein
MISRQAGVGLADIIMIIIIVSMLTSMGLKVIPPYLEHRTMSHILSALAEAPSSAARSKYELRKLIARRFDLNQLGSFDMENNIKLDTSSRGTTITLDYEVRENLVANIDIVMSFADDYFISN